MDKRITVFLPVLEDWSPSFKTGYEEKTLLVRVCIMPLTTVVRVSVWGADDLGMEKDYSPEDYAEALLQFNKVIQKKHPTRDWLKQEGFNYS